jgi:hypothetical protein
MYMILPILPAADESVVVPSLAATRGACSGGTSKQENSSSTFLGKYDLTSKMIVSG